MKLPAWLDGHIFTFSWRFGGTRVKLDREKFVAIAKQLVGKKYVFGVEVDPKTPPEDVQALDCSEGVEYLFAQVGIKVPDGSYNQAAVCRKIRPDEALQIGDLGFKHFPDTGVIHHVGIYLDGVPEMVWEAKGRDFGVVLTPLARYIASAHFAFWGRLAQLDA